MDYVNIMLLNKLKEVGAMYIAKRRGCGLVMFASASFICWVVFGFINIQTWIAGGISIILMAIFDYACKKEYNKILFGPNNIIGIIVFLMVGLGMGLSWYQIIICAIFMPLIYTMVLELYLIGKNHVDDYTDDE